MTVGAVRAIIASLLIVVSTLFAGDVDAETRASVIATDPAGESIRLARDQPLYVRVDYATDLPVSIWARPYFKGQEVSAKTNASIRHEGKGQALGWFSLDRAGE